MTRGRNFTGDVVCGHAWLGPTVCLPCAPFFPPTTTHHPRVMTPTATSVAPSAMKENLTLMATHESKLELVRSEAKKPGPGEALVHVKATG